MHQPNISASKSITAKAVVHTKGYQNEYDGFFALSGGKIAEYRPHTK